MHACRSTLEDPTPVGVTIASDGSIIVLDQYNSLVSRFTPAGAFVERWGSAGSGDGQLSNPSAIATGPTGDLYVVDQGNSRIVRFTSAGVHVLQWGGAGAANGQFDLPSGIGVDRRGDVYVTDVNNHRVQKFTASGRFLRAFGTAGSGNGQFTAPVGIAIDRFDRVFVSDVSANRVQSFHLDGTFAAAFGSTGTASGQFRAPVALVASPGGQLLVLDQQNSRLEVFADAVPAGTQTIGRFTAALHPTGTFTLWGLASGDSGDLFVASGNGIVHVDRNGLLLNNQGVWGENAFSGAVSLDRAPDGTFWVCWANITHVRADGTVSASFTNPRGQWDISASAGGLWVSGNEVARVAESGATQATSASLGGAVTVASDPVGHSYGFNGLVVSRFGSDCALQKTWTVSPTNPEGPGGIRCDGSDILYVVDPASNRILRYDPDGNLLASVDAASAGQPGLQPLSRLAIDAQGNLVISDRYDRLLLRMAIAPRILDVRDVLGDGGRTLRLTFRRASIDVAPTDVPVTGYAIYRRIENPAPPDASPAPEMPGWELVQTLAATGADTYSVDLPTRVDATPADIAYTAFQVRALTGSFVLDSGMSFGASLDNVSPPTPTNYSGDFAGDGVHLSWSSPPGSDAVAWEIYRGATPIFDAEEDTRIATVSQLNFFDAGAGPGYYTLAALDASGNRSSMLTLGPQGLLGVPPATGSAVFALGGIEPNPGPASHLNVRFSLAVQDHASIELIDATGRRAFAQDLGSLSAGPHEIALVPDPMLPAGLYWMRLRNGNGTVRVAKVALVR